MRGCASTDSMQRFLPGARAGDGRALGQLLDRYRSYLHLLAEMHLGRRLQVRCDASDVVQSVFLRAGRYFHQFRGHSEGELLAWLRKLLASAIVDALRQHQQAACRDLRRQELCEDLDRSSMVLDQGLINPSSDSPSQQADRHEQAVLLADALARLPEPYRQVLMMRHMEQLTFSQIAQRLGRSPEAVRHLWVRALTQLRTSLGGVL